MPTPDALAGLQTFDGLNIAYGKAYANNPFKKACIENAITFLPPQARVLDVGCGTGIPVSQVLAAAGLGVHGFDISPTMISYAASRVQGGRFSVVDMLAYRPTTTFHGIFVFFSQLQLEYASLHAAVCKFARALEPDGIVVMGQKPGDEYVGDSRVGMLRARIRRTCWRRLWARCCLRWC